MTRFSLITLALLGAALVSGQEKPVDAVKTSVAAEKPAPVKVALTELEKVKLENIQLRSALVEAQVKLQGQALQEEMQKLLAAIGAAHKTAVILNNKGEVLAAPEEKK